MKIAKCAIVKTGVANLASVSAACKRLGLDPKIVDSTDEVVENELLIVPGVGAFGAGISKLVERGWDRVLCNRFSSNQPTLAICLGMQLLCESSEEAPGEKGLGIVPGQIQKFPAEVMVPQFGWNNVWPDRDGFVEGYVYFANSYCLPFDQKIVDAGWSVLLAKHGIEFVAAASKGNWLVCQFHPELSSSYGLELLRGWLNKFIESNPEADNLQGATEC